MILDAGFLVSVDRGERSAQAFLRAALQRQTPLHTTQPVVAQVWRNGGRQARLARFLASITIHPLADGRAVGGILARSGTNDVVDAHLVAVAVELSEAILTGDSGDSGDIELLVDSLPSARPKIHRWP
ncbi:MAG: twitching motility protein PilT [Acidimicrobiales bacterium]